MEPISSAKELIEQFKLKRLIQKLENQKGMATALISIIIPPKKQISDMTKMLIDEIGKAENIKDRQNRQAVTSAMAHARERLKLYNRTPPNGLALFGGIVSEDGKTEKKLVFDFEPYKPLNTTLYKCDNVFHVNDLKSLLDSNDKWGFIIMDANSCIFSSVQGNIRETLFSVSNEMPKKHGRAESGSRLAAIRIEKNAKFIQKCAETASQVFMTNSQVNVKGIILAGNSNFKTSLQLTPGFDNKLKEKIAKAVDIYTGGETGFTQALELCKDVLGSVKYFKEYQIVKKFFYEFNNDPTKVVYGAKATMEALESGAVECILVNEGLDTLRVQVQNPTTMEETSEFIPENKLGKKVFKDTKTGLELEHISDSPVVEWLADNYDSFGAQLVFVTDKSPEGFQFLHGFSGIGAFLKYFLGF